MYRLKILIAGCLLMAAASCKEDGPSPLSKDGSAPAPLISAAVETSLPGGAKLTYKMPEDENILYVKAVYESPKGNVREVKSSAYASSLVIDGLGTTNEYDVQLFAVGKNEKESAPVNVKVIPLPPPVLTTFASLNIKADYGGAMVNFENPAAGNIVIKMMTKNSIGDWKDAEIYYTKSKQGQFPITGLKSEPITFGAFVYDRWGNKSDTLQLQLTPLAETLLEKSLFKEYFMGEFTGTGANVRPTVPGSDWGAWYQGNARTRLSACWDNDIPRTTHLGTYNTSGSAPYPGSFTFDLGVTKKLSRLVYNARQDGDPTAQWSHNAMQEFEIWGTTGDRMVNQKDPGFSSNGWVKLMECKVVKPSGLEPNTPGNITDEDLALLYKGFEFRFPLNTPEVRYLRFRVINTFYGAADWHIAELTFWAQD